MATGPPNVTTVAENENAISYTAVTAFFGELFHRLTRKSQLNGKRRSLREIVAPLSNNSIGVQPKT